MKREWSPRLRASQRFAQQNASLAEAPVAKRRMRASRGFGSLIEIVIVAVIILAGVGMYLSFAGGGGGGGSVPKELLEETGASSPASQPQSLPGKALRKAISFECQNNLRQLRATIDMAKGESSDGTYPASLQALQGARGITQCPVSRQDYHYDPATGQVHCTFSGHEGY